MTENRQTRPDETEVRGTSAAIGRWQDSLLDRSRRNRLLFFKPSGFAVRIVDIVPDVLWKDLSSHIGLSFDYAERYQFSPEHKGDVSPDDPDVWLDRGGLASDCPPLELQRRLKNLQEKDNEWDHEQGMKVLYVGLGFVSWVDEDEVEGKAPLLLLPCSLHSTSPKHAFTLRREAEEPETNPALARRLGQLGIELPELGEGSFKEYFRLARHLFRGRDGWSVDRDIYVSTFAYHRLAMWQDLERLRTDSVSHPLILEMAASQGQREVSTEVGSAPPPSLFPPDAELSGGRLDDVLDLRDQFTVMNADFSQLQAVEASRSGQNMVIHGPPGTGKSQTITNIIAALIADGKRVLFVSKKRAALDAVKRNLEECNLGIFCLALHSKYAKRAAVYEQLGESASVDARGRRVRPDRVDHLSDLRRTLNERVRALHRPREPLGRSVYEMSGIYAAVRHLPSFEFEGEWISDLDENQYKALTELADGFVKRPREFREHETSRWRPLRTTTDDLNTREEIRRDLVEIQNDIERLRGSNLDVAQTFGLPEPRNGVGRESLAKLCTHMMSAPGILRLWLEPGNALDFLGQVQAAEKICDERHRLKGRIASLFGEDGEWPDFENLEETLQAILEPEKASAIALLAGEDWELQSTEEFLAKCVVLNKLDSELRHLQNVIAEATNLLDGSSCDTWDEIGHICHIGATIVDLCPVPEDWFVGGSAALAEFSSLRALAMELSKTEQDLANAFDDSFIDWVDENLAARYRTDYQSALRFFRLPYWKDRRSILEHMHRPFEISAEGSLNSIDSALKIQRMRRVWADRIANITNLYGTRFSGIETDWESVETAVRSTVDLVTAWRGDLQMLRGLLTDRTRAHSLRQVLDDVKLGVQAVKDSLGDLGDRLLPAELNSLFELLEAGLPPLDVIAETIRAIKPAESVPRTVALLFVDIKDGARLLDLEKEFDRRTPQLAKSLGVLFRGYETDWDEVLRRRGWAEKLVALTADNVPPELAQHCERPESSDAYQKRAQSLKSGFGEALSKYFVPEESEWKSWLDAPFDELIDWIGYLREHAAQAADWNDYRRSCARVDELFGAGTVAAIRERTDDSANVPGILRRAVSSAWLGHVFEVDPALREFSVAAQETIRDEFRRLDEQFPYAMREEVRHRCLSRYPARLSPAKDAVQIGVLYGELMKKRHQMPLRQLFEESPLVGDFKPCFLMSPLAVSQFLPLEPGYFDAVIFDEASQISPAEAIPAIMRSSQVVVVGDRKQLPPTSFFRRAEADESNEEEGDGEDSQVGMESILDAMVGLAGRGCVTEQYLKVHYRSKCESLIQFSNHTFYWNRPLLVFPGPQPAHVSKALRDVFVTEGRYEPGRGVNPVEAESVVDLVFELMDRYGESQSLGVVALSRAQSDLIQERISIRREAVRHLDGCFTHELAEPFFVKSLQNVQGDERDHVILTIGYGPSVSGGATPDRFGPISTEGGGRRLNVAISRARRTMTLVHSLKPSDITTQSDGARLLRAYIEYAASPIDFFAKHVRVDPAAEPESPFKEAVHAALTEKGFTADPQVGVRGSLVDVAVLSEDGTRYVLGIECDSGTSNATPAARDRDWLRQSVLESLGWKIHRVWSTAWFHNPEAELARIESAIEQATVGSQQPVFDRPAAKASSPRPAEASDLIDDTLVPTDEPEDPGPSFRPYKSAELRHIDVNTSFDLAVSGTYKLRTVIIETVRIEMPIRVDKVADRIEERWGLADTGDKVLERVKASVNAAVLEGAIAWETPTETGQIRNPFLVIPSRRIVARKPGLDGNVRRIDEVSEGEIAAGILVVAEAIDGGRRGELITQTAREFGYPRFGEDVEERIGGLVDGLVISERLRETRGILVVTEE